MSCDKYYIRSILEQRQKKVTNLFKDKKYSAVIKEATKYLEMNPNNVNVRFMRAKAYRAFNLFDEAIADLKYNIDNGFNYHSITELYYIYYFLNMYEEALKLLPTMYRINVINPVSLALSEFIMKTSMGIEMNFTSGNCDYTRNQIKKYDKEEAINHIKVHMDPESNKSIFRNDINIEYLIETVSNSIDNSKKVNTNEILELHYFIVPNIGYYENNSCNCLRVVVIPNTNKIISMYPAESTKDNKQYPILNCDYDKLFNRDNKVKSLSRIDKFNQRYNR